MVQIIIARREHQVRLADKANLIKALDVQETEKAASSSRLQKKT